MDRVLRWPSFLVVVVLLVIDFVTKRMVLAHADMLRYDGMMVIDGILRFTYVRNPGAAFGMLPGQRWVFVAVSAVAVIALTWLLTRSSTQGLKRWAYALILSGAAGNLIDRIFYDGYVVDFIECVIEVGGRTFPVFNVADMGVSVGAGLLVLSLLMEKDEPVADEEPAVEPVARDD